MNRISIKLVNAVLVAGCLLFSSCRVDTFDDIKNLEPTVSLVQVSGGTVKLTPDNVFIDKAQKLITRTMGISYAGFQNNETFTAALELNLDDTPDGYEKFAPGECFINSAGSTKTDIEVPPGSSTIPVFFNVTKAAVEAHTGKKMAAKLSLGAVSKYKLNEKAASVYILIDMNDFGNRKIDVTATYLKNATFNRAPGTTARFAPLADWVANDAVLKSRPTGAGFDANANKMGIERWSGGDSPILNGKIYQTFTLPKGAYQIDVQMGTVKPDRDTYLVVAEGETLPNDSEIATSIASKAITEAYNASLLSMPFKMENEKKVSVGFLLNFDQAVQKVVQAATIKMYRIESLFD